MFKYSFCYWNISKPINKQITCSICNETVYEGSSLLESNGDIKKICKLCDMCINFSPLLSNNFIVCKSSFDQERINSLTIAFIKNNNKMPSIKDIDPDAILITGITVSNFILINSDHYKSISNNNKLIKLMNTYRLFFSNNLDVDFVFNKITNQFELID
jgi:hypothetical protein